PEQEAQPRPPPGPKSPFHGGAAWPGMDLDTLKEQWRGFKAPVTPIRPIRTPDPLPDGARFITGSYTNPAGTRSYKLYVPSGYAGQPLPLVVMLHGCTQDPDDFAAGTRMNELAEETPCLVLYPAQAQTANGSKCWNWFKATDQERDQGEPSLIAGMTRQVGDIHAVDPDRIYVAGLSAGGAMAVTMGVSYPELYAAVGIHSGLPHGVACDLPSALAAMQNGGASPRGRQESTGTLPFPVIVFHGDRDTTVHPCNGDQIISQCAQPAPARPAQASTDPKVTVQRGQEPKGHAYTRTIHHRPGGRPLAEHWLVHGAGHAWAGGSSRGPYTDPKGPDASRQMLRFFLEHPRGGLTV
ncbi:MAG TPA: PHB depolymerase family esterase, partial [Rhodocyclaceae bacterium]|nr:PHB depolymerase family esterase [Rhodocyclaceae bacterium]